MHFNTKKTQAAVELHSKLESHFKKTGAQRVVIAGKEYTCDALEGTENGVACRKLVHKDIPFGGIAKIEYGKKEQPNITREVVEFGRGKQEQTPGAGQTSAQKAAGSIVLESPAFKDGAAIPRKHARIGFGRGEGLSPELTWSGVPEGAKELVILCSDPDAKEFTHWIVYGIDPKLKKLPEGLPRGRKLTEPVGAKQMSNDFGNWAYGGPQPPSGETHKYVFEILALDKKIENLENLAGPFAKTKEIRSALESNILAKGTLTATYSAP